MEAGAMGLPVISSDIIGCNNVVTKENGLLVPPRDVESLYQAMKTMVTDKNFIIISQFLLASLLLTVLNRRNFGRNFLIFIKQLFEISHSLCINIFSNE